MDRFEADSSTSNAPSEVRLLGRPVSRGRATGRIVCIYGSGRQFFRTPIPPERIDKEVKRLRDALHLAAKRLEKISDSALRLAGSTASILEIHRSMLDDESFKSKIERAISDEAINAEWAVKVVADEYVGRFKSLADEHFRDRYIDIEDVSEQIQFALGGGRRITRLPGDAIIAADEIRPSTIAELAGRRPRAILTENGGWTSHAFILARELEIPAITGIRKLMRRVSTNDQAAVDALGGLVTLNPSDKTLTRFSTTLRTTRSGSIADSDAKLTTKTLDGHEIIIRANFDIAESFRRAEKLGAKGIGLFRSEYLFNRSKGFPGEAEQEKIYSEIADFAGAERARIRLFDLAVHQVSDQPHRKEANPALGLRGIRLGLTITRQLRTQIRALLRASHGRQVDIIVPMVSGVEEIDEVRKMIDLETERLEKKGVAVGRPGISAMIELPSAVIGIDSILNSVDSICIGTNDLVQYLLAVDRDNESVANWFRTLHPSVLSAMRTVIESAGRAGKSAVICGEMAGSPFYVPILIGLGATELSMNVHSIARVRKVISGIALEEAVRLASLIRSKSKAEEIEAVVESFIADNWNHLFPTESLLNRKS